MSEQLQLEQWLCFQLESETYAQPVEQVKEILDYSQPVPVPGSQACVEGVLNVRGEIVTIVCAAHLLGLPSFKQEKAHIIVLETPAGMVGISVDEVDKIAFIDPEQMMPVDNSHAASPVKATIEHRNTLIILTDFGRSINALEDYE